MDILSNMKVKLGALLTTFSKTLDIVDKTLSNHHLRVSIIADDIAKAYGLSLKVRKDIFIAATLHDIGVFSLREKHMIAEYDIKNPFEHSEKGYSLMKDFAVLSNIAPIVRHHHIRWEEGRGYYSGEEKVHIGAHIIHLADRIEILLNKNTEVLNQKDPIVKAVMSRSNILFDPRLVEVFADISEKECFWFDATYSELEELILNREVLPEKELNIDELEETARLFSHIIDFRSEFTAVHSAGVSAVARALSRFVGFSSLECRLMAIAGHLHDIGKLAVPTELLEKPAKLDDEQMNVMKSHVYFSYRILESVKGLETINMWASFHHERMDAKGYPFHLKGDTLPIGSRIMAVADVLTAISEDRPYRKGMDKDTALSLLESLGSNNVLDREIIKTAAANFNYLNELRQDVQKIVKGEYESLKNNDSLSETCLSTLQGV
ncbi:HD-GYP domain-containing protein [Candidatus Magnetominusculus xianensis]|nr:HD domain-containing phosphohydrolase [Candidatus Magnetominusculus xianensis]MBF0404929.1 HD domain-containing protein [Nitrospirota bacterium]